MPAFNICTIASVVITLLEITSAVHFSSCKRELTCAGAQLLNAQNGQEMIHHDFIDTFMSDNAIPCIISGQLVIDFFIRRFFIQGNVEINRRDVCI